MPPACDGEVLAPVIVKNAQLSSSPNFARRVGPLVVVVPREPTTSALTTRGDTPRLTTRISRSLPFTSEPSFAAALDSDSFFCQRCFGETSSYGSSTDFSHGLGSPPGKPNSTFSVRPPEVEKK